MTVLDALLKNTASFGLHVKLNLYSKNKENIEMKTHFSIKFGYL